MKKQERKARMKRLKAAQKQRLKQKREAEGVSETQTPAESINKEETVMEEVISEQEAKSALREAFDTVRKVMRMVNNAIARVNMEDADKVFAARVRKQRISDEAGGVKHDEKSYIRAHPLFSLWGMSQRCATQVGRLLALVNPSFYAKRKQELALATCAANAPVEPVPARM